MSEKKDHLMLCNMDKKMVMDITGNNMIAQFQVRYMPFLGEIS